MKEEWKDIKEYEGLYQISNFGRVKSLEKRAGNSKRKEKILKEFKDKNGYIRVILCKNNKTSLKGVHRLIAEAFIPNPNNYPQINHKDEDKQNNNINNLEWCTCKYNINYGNRTKKAIGKLKIKVNQYKLDGTFIKTWDSISEAIKFYKNSGIYLVCRGKKETASGYKWEYINRRIDL